MFIHEYKRKFKVAVTINDDINNRYENKAKNNVSKNENENEATISAADVQFMTS